MYSSNGFKPNRVFRLISGLVFIVTFNYFMACSSEDDPGLPSEIKPPALLLPGKEVIPVFGPVNFSVQSADIRLEFDSSATTYAALMIFEGSRPVVDSSGTYLADISSCRGGATNMTSHPWNHTSVLMSDVSSGVYLCDPLNASAPFSNTSILYTTDLISGQTYYWVLLGYDGNYRLTHSSAMYQFIR